MSLALFTAFKTSIYMSHMMGLMILKIIQVEVMVQKFQSIWFSD